MVRETRQKEQARKQPERRKQAPKYAQNGRVAAGKSPASRNGGVVQRNGSSHSNADVPTTSNSSEMGRNPKAPSQKAKSAVTPSSNGVKQQGNGSEHAVSSPAHSSTREDTEEFYKDLFDMFVKVRDPSKPSNSSADDQQASTSTDQSCSDLGHVVPYKKKIVDPEKLANFIKWHVDTYERVVMGRRTPKDKNIKNSPTSSEVEGNPSVKASTSSETQTSDRVPSQQPPKNGTKDPVPEEIPSKEAPEALPLSYGVQGNPCVKASTSSGIQNPRPISTQQPSLNGRKALAPSSTVITSTYIHKKAVGVKKTRPSEAFPTSSGVKANPTVKTSTLSRILHALRKPSTNGTRAPFPEEPGSSKDSALIKKIPILKTPPSIGPPENGTSKKAPEALPRSSRVNGNPTVKASTSSAIQNSNATAPVTPFTNGTAAAIPEEPAPSKHSKKVSILKEPSSLPPNYENGPSEEITVALPTSSGVGESSSVKASTSSGTQNPDPTRLPTVNGTKATVSASTLSRMLHALKKSSTNGTSAQLSEEPGSSKDSALIKKVPISKTPSSIAPPESGTSKKAPESLPSSSRVNGNPSVKASTSSGNQNFKSASAHLPPTNGTEAPVLKGMRPSLKAPSSTPIASTDILEKKAEEEEPSGVEENPIEKPSTSSGFLNSEATAPENPSTNGTEALVREEPGSSKYSSLFKKVSILKAPSSDASSASVVKIKLFKRSSELFKHLPTFCIHAPKLSIRAPISKGSNRPRRGRRLRRRRLLEEFPVTQRCSFAQRENRSKTVPIWEIDEKYMNPVLPPRSKPFENPAGHHPDPPTPLPPPPSESGEEEILWDMEELDDILKEIQLGAKPAPTQLAASPSIEVVPSEIAIPQNGDASTSSSLTNGIKSSTPEEPATSTAPSSIAPNPKKVTSNETSSALPTSSGITGNSSVKASTSSEIQNSERATVSTSTRIDPEELYKVVFNALFEVRGNLRDDQQASTSTDQPYSEMGHVVPYKKKVVGPEWQADFLKWNMDLFERLVNGRKNNGNEANRREKRTDSEALPTSSGVKESSSVKASTSSEIQNPNGTKAPVSEGMRPSLKASSSSAITPTDILNKTKKKAVEEEPSEALPTSSGVNADPNVSTSSEIQNSDATILEKPSTSGTEAPVPEGIHSDTPTPPPHSESGEEAVLGEMEELDNVLQEIQLEANHAPIQLAASPSSSRETFSPEKDVSCEIDIIGPHKGETSSSATGIPEVVVLDAAAKAFLKIKDSKRRQNEPETVESSIKQRGIQAPKYVQNGRVAPPKSQVLENGTITGVLNQNTKVSSERKVETTQNGSSHSSSNVQTTSNSSELPSRSSTVTTTNRPEASNLPILDAPASSALSNTEAHATTSNGPPLQAGSAPKPQHQLKDASELPVSSPTKIIAKSSNKLRSLLSRKRQLTSNAPKESCSLPNSDGNASTSNDITVQDKIAAQPVLPVSTSSEVNTESSTNRALEVPYKKQTSTSNATESSSSLPRSKDNASSSNNTSARVEPAMEPVFRKPMLPQKYSESQQRSKRARRSKVAFTPEPMGSKEHQRGTKRKAEVAPTQDLRTERKEPPRKKIAPTRGILEAWKQEEPRKDKRGIIPPLGPSRKPFTFDLLPKDTPQKDIEKSEDEDEEEDSEENQKRSKKETKGRLKYVGKYWFPKMGKECQIEVPEWKEDEEVRMDKEERDEKDECVWSFPNETKMDQSAEDRLFEQIETKYWFAIWRQFKGHIPYGVALQHLMENNFDLLESLENIDKCLEKLPQRFKDICVEQARQFVQFQKDHQKFHKKQKYDYPQRGISHSYEATDRRELQETTLRNYHIGEIYSLVSQFHRFYMPSEEIDCKVGCTCHDAITAELQFEPRFGCKNCTKHLRDTSEYPEDKLCLICQNYKELTGSERPVKNLILDSEDSRKVEAWNQMERDLARKISREELENLEKEDTLARWKAYDLTNEEIEMLTFKRSSLMKTGQNIRPISKDQFNALDDEKKLEVFERIKAKLEPFSLRQFVTCKCKESGGITRYSQNSFPKEVEELVRIIAETKTADGEVDVEKAAEKLLEIELLEELPCSKGASPLTKKERMKHRIEHFLKFYKKKDQIWKTPEEIAQAIAQTTIADGAADLFKAADLLGEEPELIESFLKKYKKRNKIWKPWPKNSFHKFKPRKIVPNQNLPTPFSLIKSISRPEDDPSCIVEDHVATPEPESKHEAVEIKRAPSRVQTPMRRSIRMSMAREIESPEDVVEQESSPEQDQKSERAPDAPAPQNTSAKRGRGRPKGSKYSGPFADSDQDSDEDQDFDRRSQDPDFKPKRSRKRL